MENIPTLPCMNCRKPIESGESKIFAQVFVCPTCYGTAKSFYEKLEVELRQLLTVAKESIRVALVEGRFHLSEAHVRDISKRELLQEIVSMEERARGR